MRDILILNKGSNPLFLGLNSYYLRKSQSRASSLIFYALIKFNSFKNSLNKNFA